MAKEGEKLVILFDQIDLFIGSAQGNGADSDKKSIIRKEIIVQMTNAQKENCSIIVIATTDQPWNLENDLLNLMKTKI